MSRFDKYNELRGQAEDQTRGGGSPERGLIFALLAVAEAIVVTEASEKLEISGSLVIDQ